MFLRAWQCTLMWMTSVLDMDIHVYCSFIKISFLDTPPLTQFNMNEWKQPNFSNCNVTGILEVFPSYHVNMAIDTNVGRALNNWNQILDRQYLVEICCTFMGLDPSFIPVNTKPQRQWDCISATQWIHRFRLHLYWMGSTKRHGTTDHISIIYTSTELVSLTIMHTQYSRRWVNTNTIHTP